MRILRTGDRVAPHLETKWAKFRCWECQQEVPLVLEFRERVQICRPCLSAAYTFLAESANLY